MTPKPKPKVVGFKCPTNGVTAFHIDKNGDGSFNVRCLDRSCPFTMRVKKIESESTAEN